MDQPDPFDCTVGIPALATRIRGGMEQVLLLVVAQRPQLTPDFAATSPIRIPTS
ncbi:hypothetical protein [Streptomyces umbrinus]|uniref:hypothetical protein n=1 Tax=Streptomyces umbrinus TaxID=67370 RepID=UPI003C2BAA04